MYTESRYKRIRSVYFHATSLYFPYTTVYVLTVHDLRKGPYIKFHVVLLKEAGAEISQNLSKGSLVTLVCKIPFL